MTSGPNTPPQPELSPVPDPAAQTSSDDLTEDAETSTTFNMRPLLKHGWKYALTAVTSAGIGALIFKGPSDEGAKKELAALKAQHAADKEANQIKTLEGEITELKTDHATAIGQLRQQFTNELRGLHAGHIRRENVILGNAQVRNNPKRDTILTDRATLSMPVRSMEGKSSALAIQFLTECGVILKSDTIGPLVCLASEYGSGKIDGNVFSVTDERLLQIPNGPKTITGAFDLIRKSTSFKNPSTARTYAATPVPDASGKITHVQFKESWDTDNDGVHDESALLGLQIEIK